MIDLRRKGITPDTVTWSKVLVVDPRSKGSKMCSFGLSEKVFIATADKETSLNERSEVMRRCRHRDKFFLTNSLSNHCRRHPIILEETDEVQEEDPGGTVEDSEEEDGVRQETEGEDEDSVLPPTVEVGERRLRRRRMKNYKQFF